MQTMPFWKLLRGYGSLKVRRALPLQTLEISTSFHRPSARRRRSNDIVIHDGRFWKVKLHTRDLP
jgi:predicted signal transduction protein with EAL and GGDEF domain